MTSFTIVSEPDLSAIGTQSRTVTGFGVPTAALNFSTHSDLDTFQTAMRFTMGAADSTLKQSVVASKVRDNLSNLSNANSQQHVGNVGFFGYRLNVTDMFSFNSETQLQSFDTDGITLNVVKASTARVSNQLLATGVTSQLVEITEDQTPGNFVDAAINFVPDVIIAYTANDDFALNKSHNGYGVMNTCFIKVENSGATVSYAGQCCTSRYTPTTTENHSAVYDDGIRTVDPTETTSSTDGHFTISFPDSSTMRMTTVERTNDGQPATIAFLLLSLSGFSCDIGIADTPTTTGNHTFSVGGSFTPQMAMFLTNQLSSVSSAGSIVSGGDAGSYGVSCVTRPPSLPAGDLERSTNCTNEEAVTTTNSSNYTSSGLFYVNTHDQAASGRAIGTFSSFGVGQVNVNFTETPASVKKWPYLVVSDSASTPPPQGGAVLTAGINVPIMQSILRGIKL